MAESPDKQEITMYHVSRIAFVVVFLLVPGVVAKSAKAQRLEESVVCTWEIDVEATKKLGGKGAEIIEALVALKFTFEFKHDGGLLVRSIDPQARKQKGNWKAVKVDEARKELTIEAKVDGDPDRLIMTTTKAGAVMRIVGDDADLSLALRRTKGE